MITAVTALPFPSGGAVKLLIHSDQEYVSALILATPHPDIPDPYGDVDERPMNLPDLIMPVRRVTSGQLFTSGKYKIRHGRHVHMVMDLDSDALQDGAEVYYHVFEELEGTYADPLSIAVTPACARSASATLARTLIMRRLRYHIGRSIEDGTIPYENLPVLEKEVRFEGQDIPAILVRETATPNPSAETIGHHDTELMNSDGSVTLTKRYAYRVRVDVLALTDNPGDRQTLEKWLKETLPADLDYYQHGGIEEPQFSFFPNHTIDADSTDEYTIEATFEGTVYIRVFEEHVPMRDNTTLR